MQPSDVAVKANKFDPNSQSFTPATPAITPSLAAFNQQMVNAKPPALDTITSDTMKGVTPVPLATPKVPDYTATIASSLTDVANLEKQARTQEEAKLAEAKSISSSKANLETLLGGKAADTAQTYQAQGVNTAYNQLQDLNAQATGLLNEAKAIPIQVENQAMGTGATEAGIAPITSARLRDNALKALSLGQQAAIATANYDKAKNYADQIVNAKYDQIQADINAKITNLQALKDFDLSPAQEKARLAREERLNAEKQVNEDKRTNEKALSDLVIKASSQGAPSALLEKAKLATNPMQAATILGAYAGDYWETKLKIAQYNKTIADTNKINAEASGTGGVNIPGQSVAQSYLAQYNSGVLELGDIYTKIGSSKSAEKVKNEFANLVAAQGGKRVLSLDDAQISSIDAQIENIDSLLAGGNYKTIAGPNQKITAIGSRLSGKQGDYLAAAENLIANQTLQSLADAKAKGITFGALSGPELNAVASAASRVASKAVMDKDTGKLTGFTGSTEGFKSDLETIKNGLAKSKQQKTGGTSPGGVAGQVDLADKIINTPSGGGTGGYQFNN